MPELIPMLSKEEIDKMVSTLALQISLDYDGRTPVILGVLKGAFIFLADLLRYLTIPVEVDFLRVSSYGAGTSSSGNIRLTKEIETNIAGRDILVVEDIIDTGLTLNFLLNYLKNFDPLSVRVCSLINKIEVRKKKIKIDYIGHVVQQGFLVGYGLDYNESYRNLPEIYHLKL